MLLFVSREEVLSEECCLPVIIALGDDGLEHPARLYGLRTVQAARVALPWKTTLYLLKIYMLACTIHYRKKVSILTDKKLVHTGPLAARLLVGNDQRIFEEQSGERLYYSKNIQNRAVKHNSSGILFF